MTMPARSRSVWAAAAVHVFTASGAVCALFATRAVLNHEFEMAFAWLGLALLIDGLDGVFARAAKVELVLSRFSGERLDLVVDYLTYVFVPVLALIEGGFLVGWFGLTGAGLILLSALFHFADLQSKSDDNCFVGFPAVWNLLAFYIFALDPPRPATLLVLAVFVCLTFIPWRWVHPLRVRSARPFTIGMALFWVGISAWVLVSGFGADALQSVLLMLPAAYICGLAVIWRKPLAGEPDREVEGP